MVIQNYPFTYKKYIRILFYVILLANKKWRSSMLRFGLIIPILDPLYVYEK